MPNSRFKVDLTLFRSGLTQSGTECFMLMAIIDDRNFLLEVNMNRYKGIIATGAIAGLVIITLLVVGLGNIGAVDNKDTAVQQETAQIPQTSDGSNDEVLQAWQQYSADLEQVVLTMRERESRYQMQINLANQTIIQLQDELNAANTTTSSRVVLSNENHEGFEHDDD
jgi:hypothetical protein